jgi:hypothetical protein
MPVNIFDEVDYETTRSYFKFAVIGDKVQGTYVSRDDNTVDGYKNPQTLVGLLQPDNSVKTVSIRHNKVGLLEELDKVIFGQIIGFIFTGTKDNPGKQPTKFIRLVHDPKFVDEAWLAARKKEDEAANDPTAGMTPNDIFGTTPAAVSPAPAATVTVDASVETLLAASAAPVMSDSDKIKEIAVLAKTKLNANGVEEVKTKIKESTGLDFVTTNLDAILAKLKTL